MLTTLSLNCTHLRLPEISLPYFLSLFENIALLMCEMDDDPLSSKALSSWQALHSSKHESMDVKRSKLSSQSSRQILHFTISHLNDYVQLYPRVSYYY